MEEEQEEILLHATQKKNVDMVKAKDKKESKHVLCKGVQLKVL